MKEGVEKEEEKKRPKAINEEPDILRAVCRKMPIGRSP